MDEARLKNILGQDNAPPADENARKRAVNLAVAAFKEERQKKSQKTFQGFSILSRLTGRSTQSVRRNMMEKKSYKKLYLGTALMIAGVGFISAPILLSETIDAAGAGASSSNGNNFSHIANNMTMSTSGFPNFSGIFGSDRNRGGDASGEDQAAMPEQELRKEAPARHSPKTSGRTLHDSAMLDEKMMVGVAASPAFIATDIIAPQGYKDVGRDRFEDFEMNPFKSVAEEPVSTFSSDVDTASYSFVRRQLNNGVLPQKDAVRIEEMINYFDYDYPVPESREEPFKPSVAIMDSPWTEGRKLMHIGIKGYEITSEKPHSNLVFLLDVSGSMNSPDKLPLLKNSMKLLLDTLEPDDTVAIAVYAGAAGTVLEPTKASEKSKIIRAIDNLNAGGSTAGAEGIELAYQLASENFEEEAVNRVILATDGDFNVGITNPEELQDYVERKRKSGIYLSVLGFGQGNYNDYMMQTLAQNGNGVAAYIDSLNEARKVLVEEASSSLFPIAKDVKFQIEFNPKTVAEYRLIGYETRHLEREDFNNDAVDAGDMGAGHTVTAIYEFVPVDSVAVSIDPLRYGAAAKKEAEKKELFIRAPDQAEEYAFLKIRYKLPGESKSKLIERAVTAGDTRSPCPSGAQCFVAEPSYDVLFSIAVAAFGQILKGGQYTGDYSYDDVIALAQGGKGGDPYGYRTEFIQMVRMAKSLDR